MDKRHPWNQSTIPKPQKRDFNGNYTWVEMQRQSPAFAEAARAHE